MDAISQTSAFSWMKMFELWLEFHWSLFLSITLLPAWGYDPLHPGDPRWSQGGVRTAFQTKDNNRYIV